MAEHILFLTGRLAEKSLRRVLEEMQPSDFTYEVRALGISVAGLMTADMIGRRLDHVAADRILVPGRCRGDLDAVADRFGLPVERGPEELKDIPQFFGGEARVPDLSRHAVRIFAEIVDAPKLSLDQILSRAARYREHGADVIDVGCLPQTPFPHLEESIVALKDAGFDVSVDSLLADDLRRGATAGADYLLSLTEDSLSIADEGAATPILIPRTNTELASLYRAMDAMIARGRRFIADPILDPIHFGFTESLVRYHALRKRYPGVDIMMGTGNLTELTEADTTGITATLMGIVSELEIGNVLVTEVSTHCATAVREADLARRIMYYARASASLPKHVDAGLTTTHERKPFPYSPSEVAELAAAIKDPSFRIQVSDQGIHVFNRDGLHTAGDPYELFPLLGVEDDGGHAFYLGVELARAQIAAQLGKRYVQDQQLNWGCLVDTPEEQLDHYREAGPTMQARKRRALSDEP